MLNGGEQTPVVAALSRYSNMNRRAVTSPMNYSSDESPTSARPPDPVIRYGTTTTGALAR